MQAARAAGLRPAAIDLFGDEDTLACAARTVTLAPQTGLRFPRAALRDALGSLRAAAGEAPIVWGSGFEGDPATLLMLEASAPVLGCSAAARTALSDPWAFAATLAALGLAHPPVARARPDDTARWLLKRRGAAGGAHVREAPPGARVPPGCYVQRHVAGRSLSAAFLAARDDVRLLGIAEHLSLQHAPGAPFRYGGAIGAAAVSSPVRDRVAHAVRVLCRAHGLVGLCGMDFVLDREEEITILEVNPRPTATFDLLTEPGAALAAHLALCRGGSAPDLPPVDAPRGHAVLYAARPARVPKAIDWPRWVCDRPRALTAIPQGAPVCSVAAGGADVPAVRRRLGARFAWLARFVHAFEPGARSRGSE